MPVDFKDYYASLGVPKTATSDEIRTAFRKLARQYHPDVAKDKKNAEEKFKEINEAYEVLGDAEKRKKYDELGADWNARGSRPPPGEGGAGPGGQYRTHAWRSGGGEPGGAGEYEFSGTGFSDFFEQFFGGSAGRFARRGGFPDTEIERGRDSEADMMVTLEEASRGGVRPITLRRNRRCPKCEGEGVVGRKRCPQCNGVGEVVVEEHYQLKIPAGVRAGQRLRLSGRGEQGSGGGPAGDLYLRVRLASHPDFRVEGGDLYHDLDLAPWEAALGAQVPVPTMNGPVKIKIPPGTQNGSALRVRGRGLPGGKSAADGDLYVVAHVQMPTEITARERELWEQLARESHFKPRG